MPFDAVFYQSESEDQNAPELVNFYGQTYEGDGFFYVIDKSGSMKDGELDIAKREILKNIGEFSDEVQFGIVLFDGSVDKFPASGQPAKANRNTRASARSFVQGAQLGNGSCPQQGIVAGLMMANASTAERKVIVYVGDGEGACQGASEADYLRQTLTAIASQNYQRIQINAIGVLHPGPINVDFMRRLAASNGGTYTLIAR